MLREILYLRRIGDSRLYFRRRAGGSILKICLFKQEIKINMTFGEQLSRRTFRSQNKYFTCVKIPQASSSLRRRISNLPELRSPNTITEYHKADMLVCVLSTTFLRSVQRRGIHRGIYLPSTAINFLIKLRASERCGRIFRSEAARWEIDFCRRVGRNFFFAGQVCIRLYRYPRLPSTKSGILPVCMLPAR